MTNGAVALLRKRWASLMGWAAAMEYSAFDFTNDRIGRLERELEQLKDELRRTRASTNLFPFYVPQRVISDAWAFDRTRSGKSLWP